MMKLVELKSYHATAILHSLRQYDKDEVAAMGYGEGKFSELSQEIQSYIVYGQYTQCLLDDGIPVVMAGIIKHDDDVDEYGCWLLASHHATSKHMRFVATEVKKILAKHFGRYIVVVWEGHKVSHRWLKGIGFIHNHRFLHNNTGEWFIKYVFESKDTRSSTPSPASKA